MSVDEGKVERKRGGRKGGGEKRTGRRERSKGRRRGERNVVVMADLPPRVRSTVFGIGSHYLPDKGADTSSPLPTRNRGGEKKRR